MYLRCGRRFKGGRSFAIAILVRANAVLAASGVHPKVQDVGEITDSQREASCRVTESTQRPTRLARSAADRGSRSNESIMARSAAARGGCSRAAHGDVKRRGGRRRQNGSLGAQQTALSVQTFITTHAVIVLDNILGYWLQAIRQLPAAPRPRRCARIPNTRATARAGRRGTDHPQRVPERPGCAS
jgi:hypothetical protein